ncbi:MAG: copper chaperone PCu(A)C [Myxococcales bacterium]|nr:copper chaperone PCu(A)C [Myxococcales bacterium]MCB9735261.1 copper chaperone PCu(A)C [Deltaproteobacteria bacterium]
MSGKLALAFVLALLLAPAARAADPPPAAAPAAKIEVVDPYVRLMPPGAPNTAAFMELRNPTDAEIRLVAAENGYSKRTELHTHTMEGGVMKMRQVPFIAVPARGSVKLAPGGLHIMMLEVPRPLAEGEVVALTLRFDDGSSAVVKAPARRPVAR